LSYQAEISRTSPTAILMVMDQSTSMNHRLNSGQSKAAFLADVLNKTLYTIITNCSKADGVRDYFHVGVVAYGGKDAAGNGFQGGLGDEALRARADEYDRTATFPKSSFDALFGAGLLGATIPVDAGGLGFGHHRGNTFPLWMMTKLIAKADLSLARCWEGHTNSLVLIDAMGTPQQKQRWFSGVVERGEIWVGWSGEPSAPKPGERARFGTMATPTADGWIINGSKAFATSASGATHAILLVNTEGPGGARHSQGAPDGLLMLACDLSDRSISIDTSWWDPVGMRATASHLVRFDNTFVSRDCLIGKPGSYLLDQWQTAFVPHYAASFLGAAEAAYEYAVKYVKHQNKGSDPYIQHRIGSIGVHLASGLCQY